MDLAGIAPLKVGRQQLHYYGEKHNELYRPTVVLNIVLLTVAMTQSPFTACLLVVATKVAFLSD